MYGSAALQGVATIYHRRVAQMNPRISSFQATAVISRAVGDT